jgi:hypothetical protein
MKSTFDNRPLETEVRRFYDAYRTMEATARGYHRAATRHQVERDCLFFALIIGVFLGIMLYQSLL